MSDSTITESRGESRDESRDDICGGPLGESLGESLGEVEQLRLLDTSDRPLQHRLDLDTRRRGLAHVAEIRRLLAAQAARRAA